MLLSVEWLKDYVDIDVPVDEFCDRMIMTGSNIETCSEIGTGISGVKLGRIDKIKKHPNADHLVICEVNTGKEEPVQVVTSAENIFEGAYVPVALDGSHIPGPLHGQPKPEDGEGVTIHKGEMRGVKSDGMLCGPQELGYDDKVAPYASKDGIWIIPGEWDSHLGEDFNKALGLKDSVVDFEITPNRPDCLCMLGMAREAAATFGKNMKYPETQCEKTQEKASDYIDVEVRSDLCKRYTARVIKNVKIKQSPWWLQKRLIAAGMRPINNIVDLTNFVMLEYGQPLHAFDIRHLEGQKIIVDTAEDGQKFVTLDGVERTLDSSMLMINDAEKPVAVAGVMGGLNSEIVEDTSTVVLESASFLGSSVRMTAKKLGMRTEASSRLEKGIDPNNCEAAADRFCRLIEELDCGTVLDGSVDVYKNPEKAPVVTARVSRINKVLGTDISREQMETYLRSLEMKVEGTDDDMVITPPTVRMDLLEEVDYVEEVARMYGYDNLPMTLPECATQATTSKSWDARAFIRETLCGLGANEIQTYSFSNDKILDQAGYRRDCRERDFVKIENPMGEDTSALRTCLVPAMLETLSRNTARNIEKLRAFEIGNVYRPDSSSDTGVKESYHISFGAYGPKEDFFTVKGILVAMLKRAGIRDLKFIAEKEDGTYHPGRCARIMTDAGDGKMTELGIMGEFHPDVLEAFGITGRAYGAEFSLDAIMDKADREVQYTRPPVYPSTSRDVAMIVSEDTRVGDIEDAIRSLDDEYLKDVKLFDIFRGDQVGEGKKSVAFSMTYRNDAHTITDQEADAAHRKVLDMLKEKFNAVLRD